MRIAVQQHMLPGRSIAAQWAYARALGVNGVEVMADGLTELVPEISEAVMTTGVQVAAVHMGRRDGYIAPEREEREAAIGALRQAMADAVDLGAAHVVFVPHYGPTRMPDLTPYRAPVELEAEMMIWLLRTVSDLAYAMEIELDIQPVNHYETYFVTQLSHARRFREKVKDHEYIKIAANLRDMAMEEPHMLDALRAHLPHIGYLQLAEPNGRLPGQGMMDFPALVSALEGYEGWLTCCTADCPQRSEIADCLTYLCDSGFVWEAGPQGMDS